MERIAGDVERLHLGLPHLDALGVGALIERALDLQAGLCRGCTDQLDDGETGGQRAAAPVLRDVTEQAMLDLVPLRGPRRIVMDVERKPRLVGELLQLGLPEPHAGPVRAAAVRRDRQLFHARITRVPHALEPGADRCHGELGRVGRDPDTDKAFVGGDIVDAVRHDLAERLVLEVVDPHAMRIALGAIVGTAVLEAADELLLLRVDRDDGLASRLGGNDMSVDVLELRVAIGMARAFVGLAIVLTREAELDELLLHRVGADRMAHLAQSLGELVHALRHPDQRAHGIAQRRRFDKASQRRNEPRVLLSHSLATGAAAANPTLRQGFAGEIVLAAVDGGARKPRDARDNRERPPTGRPHLAGREQAPPSLVEFRADRFPPGANRIFVDHASCVTTVRARRESCYGESKYRNPTDRDSIIVRSVLSWPCMSTAGNRNPIWGPIPSTRDLNARSLAPYPLSPEERMIGPRKIQTDRAG